jgi:hypothetical protein
MVARPQPAVQPLLRAAWLVAACSSACTDPPRFSYVLTDEAVVVGLSLSVIEDGPYADDLASLPADRPRAEVLPLDTVELDALVVDVDGPRDLGDAAWVLCGEPCLGSLRAQGERYGELEPCSEGSAARSFACLAGRGERPRTVMPAIDVNRDWPLVAGAFAFVRAAVIVGSPGGPTTDECLEQLTVGPRSDLWGCAIGVRELPYGPPWTLQELVDELEAVEGVDSWVLDGLLLELGIFEDAPQLPPLVAGLLLPNAAPRIEEVEVGGANGGFSPALGAEIRSVHEPVEVEAGVEVLIGPVVSPRDRQLVLDARGPDSWVGRYENVSVQAWTDRFVGPDFFGFGGFIHVDTPTVEGPLRLYVLVTDEREGVSWFTLDLEVVAR